MEIASDDDVTQRIAASVRTLRQQAGLSLEELAAASGVSRSALSQIERAQSSPTAVVLARIATGLDVPLASLFGSAGPVADPQPVARLAEQPTWKDPASGYLRRAVSPAQFPSPIQIVEVLFPAGARVSIDNVPQGGTVHQQIWMLEGSMAISVGDTAHRLQAGDCLAHTLDAPTHFHNPTRKPARYAVVLVSDARKA